MEKQLIGVVDCETTGLKPASCGLIEFTVAILDPVTLVEVDRYRSGQISILPGSFEVQDAALECNGYDAGALHLGRNEWEVVPDFVEFCKRYGKLIFLSYNSFDWEFVSAMMERQGSGDSDLGMNQIFSHRRIDMQSFFVARNLMTGAPNASTSLATVCKEFGIVNSKAHSSDGDVTAIVELMWKFLPLVPWAGLFWASAKPVDYVPSPAETRIAQELTAEASAAVMDNLFSGAEAAPVRGMVSGSGSGEPIVNGGKILDALFPAEGSADA